MIRGLAFVAQSLSFEIPLLARLGLANVGATVIWLSWTVPMFVYDCVRVAASRRSPARPAAGAAQR